MAGDCYQSAGSYLMDTWFAGDPGRFTLVHGRPTLQVEPFIEYGHAWIEYTEKVGEVDGRVLEIELVLDTETGATLPKELYYRVGQIDPAECLRYTFEEMRTWIRRTGHWGPWEGPEACGPAPGHNDEEEG